MPVMLLKVISTTFVSARSASVKEVSEAPVFVGARQAITQTPRTRIICRPRDLADRPSTPSDGRRTEPFGTGKGGQAKSDGGQNQNQERPGDTTER